MIKHKKHGDEYYHERGCGIAESSSPGAVNSYAKKFFHVPLFSVLSRKQVVKLYLSYYSIMINVR